jgi:hypothetical protein
MSTEYSSASQPQFRETEQYREYCLSHQSDRDEATFSDCCAGDPIGECVHCGDRVCGVHGVPLDEDYAEVACCFCEEARLDKYLNDNDLDGPRATVVITQLQIIALAEMAGVA